MNLKWRHFLFLHIEGLGPERNFVVSFFQASMIGKIWFTISTETNRLRAIE